MTSSTPENPYAASAFRQGSAALEKAFDDGVIQGRNAERKDLLRWLEAQYIDRDDRPDRGSPEGEAILQVVRDAMKHFQAKR